MCKFEALHADLIIFLWQIDNNGGIFFTDHDTVGSRLTTLYFHAFGGKLYIFIEQSCVHFDDGADLGVIMGTEQSGVCILFAGQGQGADSAFERSLLGADGRSDIERFGG